jgi:GWxTD domain-containing protein
MSMKRAAAALVSILLLASLLLASPMLFADGLSKKYKSWDRTPEAYFLTRAERAGWKSVKTDADAQNFILDYKTRRGPEWEKTLNERIVQADKYFSAGEVKGSETLRGKIVIMFGPPSGTDASIGREKRTAGEDANTNFTMHPEFGGSTGGKEPTNYAPPHAQTPSFTLLYDAPAAPKAIGKPFKVEVKMISRSDQETWDPKGLDDMFEKVAMASIMADPPKPQETR